MNELTELRFEDNRLFIKDNLVRSPILPGVASELERDVIVQGNCVIEGAVYARNLQIEQGPLRIKASVFTQLELHVNADARGSVVFEKAVGSANAVVSHASGCRLHFLSDISAKQVKLRNAYVAASVFADEIVLEDCVIIGGVFGTRTVELHNCIVGTFNSPTVRCSKTIQLLLPSAFSVESISVLPGTECYNLSLADLGALMRGAPQLANSGRIPMNLAKEEQRTVLADEGHQQILRSYSVVGKVLAADLLDLDRLQNHFLLTNAALGNQLLKTYDLGVDKDGKNIALTPERIADFFFDMLDGKIQAQDLDGTFKMSNILDSFNAVPSAEMSAGAPAKSTGEAANVAQVSSITEPATIVCVECGHVALASADACLECGCPLPKE
jgi:hypothetical protein